MVNERKSGYQQLLAEMLLDEDALLRDVPRISVSDSPKPALGGIHLMGKLGQGGMGSVYLGWHARLETEVAVKVLPPYLARRSSEVVQRFLREARLAARIQSPHLVGVRDVNEENGFHYIVMEYVEGISAGKYVDEFFEATGEGLPEAKALDIVAAATEGLAAAHANGTIHRDIKPDNILIPRDEQGQLKTAAAKLADLGLARPSGFGAKLTEEGFVVGTPGFLSPEQASDARTAGKPTDVFGMGATLYALLTGKAPFDGDTSVNALVASITREPKPLKEIRPDVSPATLALVARCIAKKPEQRFADAAVLKKALAVCRQALGKGRGEQDQACTTLRLLPGDGKADDPEADIDTVVRMRPTPSQTRRGPRPFLLLSVAAIALLVCLLGYLTFHTPASTESTPDDLHALSLNKVAPPTEESPDRDRGRPRPPLDAGPQEAAGTAALPQDRGRSSDVPSAKSDPNPPQNPDGKAAGTAALPLDRGHLSDVASAKSDPSPPPEAKTPDRLALSGHSYWLPPAEDSKHGDLTEAARRAYDPKQPHPLADHNSEMPYRLELRTGDRKAPLYVKDHELLAVLEPGLPFQIHLDNQSGEKMAVALYLDGENTLEREALPPSGTLKWLLDPGKSTNIEGWQLNRKVAEKFVFKKADAVGAAPRPSRLTAVVYREPAKQVTRGGEVLKSPASHEDEDPTKEKDKPNDEKISSRVTQTKLDLDPVPAAVLNVRLVTPAEVEGLTRLP